MRYELHLLLWLVAAGLLVLGALRMTNAAPLPAPLDVPSAPPDHRADVAAEAPRPNEHEHQQGPFRPLFRFDPATQTAAIEFPSAPVSQPPLLKGIIERTDGLAAVLASVDGSAAYQVLSAGDLIDGTELLSVDRDGVVLRLPDDRVVTLKLRGMGESE